MFKTWSAYRQYKNSPPEYRELVIYSEGVAYWRFFAPIVEKLWQNHGQKVCYVSSDKNDPGLNQDNILGIYIGEGFWRTVWFHNVQAKVVVMTMPDLHTSHLKRSHYPVHYVYLFHAMMSSHSAYLESAFDYYDTVLCATQYHIDELRKVEQIYRLKEKNLIPAGYPLLDKLLEDYTKYQAEPSGNHPFRILYAPSWGDNLSLVNYGEQIIEKLLEGQHQVIFRPHSQSVKNNADLIKKILKQYENHPLFNYQDQSMNNDQLFNTDLLVTDWSGMGFEFALVMKKPIIFIDTPMKLRNVNYKKVGIEAFEISYRHKAGEILSPENVTNINTVIENLMVKNTSGEDDGLLSQQLFNLGNSANIIADELINLIQQ